MAKHKRLKRIVELIDYNSKVLDIGTDHGYVPIYLINERKTNIADCSDVADGPINIAKRNIKKYDLNLEINVFKSDGLKEIPNISKYDTFIIAGMGGKLISNILMQKKINQKLILHPTNNDLNLRKTLQKLNYKITHEEILKEGKIYNLIIKAEKKKFVSKLSKRKLFMGPKLIKSFDPEVFEFYERKNEHLKSILNQDLKNKKIKKQVSFLTSKIKRKP